jgi:hypothetical protein
MATRPSDVTRLPADLLRDLEWLQRYRPALLQALQSNVRSTLVLERNPQFKDVRVRDESNDANE